MNYIPIPGAEFAAATASSATQTLASASPFVIGILGLVLGAFVTYAVIGLFFPNQQTARYRFENQSDDDDFEDDY